MRSVERFKGSCIVLSFVVFPTTVWLAYGPIYESLDARHWMPP